MKSINTFFQNSRKTIAIIFLLSALACLTGCVQFRESTSSMQSMFPESRFDTIQVGKRTIRYMSIYRSDTLPTLLFLHGSPSSMSVFNTYYNDPELLRRVNILAIDRPGYGYSNLGRAEKSVKRQAEYMWKVIDKERVSSSLYVIAASYGGTVGAKMAMLRPNDIDGLLLVSASLAPGLETTYLISYVIEHPPFRWFIPRMIRTANTEKLTHYEALTSMKPYWDKIIAPVIFIYGTADKLIFPENARFAIDRLANSRHIEDLPLEGEGHFLQLKYKDLILSKLFNLIDSNSRHNMAGY